MLIIMAAGPGAEAAGRPITADACNPAELSPCAGAIASGAPPSGACCGKLKQQQPCLCGYIKNPNFRQFVTAPGAKAVLRSCGVAYPSC
ncbi:Probable non-specific lipid-transfer protein AKCS9 [Linum grandiflorum]